MQPGMKKQVAGGSTATLLVPVLIWLGKQFGVEVPIEVASAAAGLFGYLVRKFGG